VPVGRNTTLTLLLASIGAVLLTYIALLHRRLDRLTSTGRNPIAPDLRESLDGLLTRLDPPIADQFRAGIRRYEDLIEDLRDQLRPLTFPLRPLLVEGGRFTIGADGVSSDEGPRHEVEIDSFLVDPCPVTNQQFQEFVTDPGNRAWSPEAVYAKFGIPYFLCEFVEGSFPADKWDHPVVWINWHVAVAFCVWRSNREGREPVYEFRGQDVCADFSRNGWRLPTEAEWERLAREGLPSSTLVPETHPASANYARHYRGTTSVGRFKPNHLGVWDLFGNVKEWCHDWYDPNWYRGDHSKNPRGPDIAAEFKVFRGASWMESLPALRVTRRGKLPPANTNPDLGFRCVRRA
jgi:formylglycine-generating enzyme required for sulfatase activity